MTDEERIEALNKKLDERNEATKAWIQAETQTREFANSLLRRIKAMQELMPPEYEKIFIDHFKDLLA